MARSILSVIAGYGVMAVLTLVLFVVLAAVDPESFSPEATAVPGAGGLIATLVGGLLAAAAVETAFPEASRAAARVALGK